MSELKKSYGANYWFAFSLIGFGVLILLDNLGFIYFDQVWDYWPVILIVIGVSKLINSGFKDVFPAAVLLTIGTLFLLDNMQIIYDAWDFWPLIFIFIGGRLLLNQGGKSVFQVHVIEGEVDENRINAMAFFGGKEMRNASDKFEGGDITVAFGGATVNLADAKLSPHKNMIDVFVMFGGAEIFVPKGWNVVLKGVPIFGGFSDERKNVEPPSESLPENTLIVSGFVMFGGIEVKNA